MADAVSAPLTELYRHHLWANLRLLDACAPLGDDVLDAGAAGTYGSVRATLVHLLAAEERYMAAFGVEPPGEPLREGTWPGLDELRRRAEKSGEALISTADSLEPGRLLTGERGGRKYAIPATVFLTQAINHGTEHRAHVATCLTQAGVTPPGMDAWEWVRHTGQYQET
jgi:uncharacterized damage-inducible protein DinB